MRYLFVAILSAVFASSLPLTAQQENPPAQPLPAGTADGDSAWKELEKALWLPPPPADWSRNRPTEAQIDEFNAHRLGLIENASEKARDFYVKFPQHPKADEARQIELKTLQVAVQGGKSNVIARLEARESELLKSPNLSEDERFHLRLGQVDRKAGLMIREDSAAGYAELAKGAQALVKEFPSREEAWNLLLMAAFRAEPEEARRIANEFLKNPGAASLRSQALDLLTRLSYIGKVMNLQFTAIDGRKVDLAALRGKAVLVDFWATWCGPCIAELPEIKEAYEKLHSKGFEIVGISFDRSKEQLEQFVKARNMPWPQYFEKNPAGKHIGQQFGVGPIPNMWLLDKKGVVRDQNGQDRLIEKVEKLLAESD